jgi:probable rRNA maturation factor
VRLTDDAELGELNARFLHVHGPTDVLAFPADEPGRVGDIAISVERACAQNPDAPAELRLLAVHGLLHCLGHDHAEPTDAMRMVEAADRILGVDIAPSLIGGTRRHVEDQPQRLL